MSDLTWRGFVIHDDADDGWSTTYKDGYLGVTFDRDGASLQWSALIECGQLCGQGDGISAHAALENALTELRSLVGDHSRLIRAHFKEP